MKAETKLFNQFAKEKMEGKIEKYQCFPEWTANKIEKLQSQLKKERSDILKITNKNTPCFLRINKIRNIVKLKTNQL